MRKKLLVFSLFLVILTGLMFTLKQGRADNAAGDVTYEYYVVASNQIATKNLKTGESGFGGNDLDLMQKNLDYMGKNGWQYRGFIYGVNAIIFQRQVH